MHEYLQSFEKLEFEKIIKHLQRYSTSDLGREHFHKLRPLSDLTEIRQKLSYVTEFKKILETEDPLPLDSIPDTRVAIQRCSIENFFLSASDLKNIRLNLTLSKKCKEYFSLRGQSYPLIYSLVSTLYVDKILEYNIDRAVDEDGHIKDSATKELAAIRRQIIQKKAHLHSNLESLLKQISEKDWIQDEIVTTRDGRMVIPVKAEHKNRVPGFIHTASASGATVFIEPAQTLELNNEIRTLILEEEREIEKILKDLTKQITEVQQNLLQNINVLGEIDFIQAKAKYSIAVMGSEPIVKPAGRYKLDQAYHPLLLQKHARKEIQPLNIDIPDECYTVLITGPNAGGKSVAMKTVGILSLLVQSGCHIPASPESEIRIFNKIFVDMGDEQSIEDDLSSFSSHLKNLKEILTESDDESLVLIDEIGSGTDPVEGSSIAAALLEKLTERMSLNIITTHHGALKAHAFETKGMQNAAMEFDQGTLKPTYKFRLGVPGSSFAIERAERMNMPSDVITKARILKGSDANKLENLIIDLERQSQELQIKLEKVNSEKSKLDILNSNYQNKITSLEKEIKVIKARALDEAKNILRDANRLIENSVREIRETSANRLIVRKAKEEIKKAKENITDILQNVNPSATYPDLKPGDQVHLKEGKSIGEIVSKFDDDYYIIQAGDLRLKIHRKELEISHTRNERKVFSNAPNLEQKNLKREIDLRGMYADEAIPAVDKFIDDAILTGLNRIDIIHGKGTGALRKKITEHLKNKSAIKSFRLGEWNEGGTGVTVVELE
ncbi:MAG: endonuclease MutS2 [Ignavibacteriales bacterium]|nr:endonuclease MutS2 [Ignavibacteriales bacterium]